MPWVRIDDNATDHPKFIAINANAWRLWCEGLTYCQKHLTDGLIPRVALRGMRYYSPAAVKALTAVLVPGKGPLWHLTDAGDVRVHDYLDHNDDRATVLAKREAAKSRMQRRRSREQPSEQYSERAQERTAKFARGGEGEGIPQASKEREGGAGETVAQRAGAFSQWYEDTHQRLLGVGYMGSQRDWQTLLTLCEKFTDQQLRDAAIVWFGADDDFARNGTRTIPKFASRVSGYLELVKAKGIA